MAINTKAYIEKFVKIRDKEGHIIPLTLNEPQMKLYRALAQQDKAGKPMRAIVLKARQMGFSTLTEAIIFKRTATKRGVRSGIVAHKDESTANLFNMSKLIYNNLPDELRPERKASNAYELVFDNREGTGLGSSIRAMTAGGQGIGRSDTFQNLHLSEFAFWPGDKKLTLAGIMQAVPAGAGTMVVIESTANGFDEFKAMWDRAVAGESDFVPVFCGWWELAGYRRLYDGFDLTDAEQAMQARYGLDCEQLAWRRWCIDNMCGGDEQLFRQEYPACPEEAFLSTGECVFDQDAVSARLASAPPAKRVRLEYALEPWGDRETLRFVGAVQHKHGECLVYEEPKAGVPYVVGADTAGDGSDWFVAQVLDNRDGRQVAVLRRRYDEDAFAREVCALGYWYNTALLGIEANFSTFPIKECERLGYPRQFMREVEDSYTHKMQKRYGVRTTAQTRPIMVAGLIAFAREQIGLIQDAQTLREMLVFVRNERGKAEAMQGEHDDCVMALAIAHYIRPQQTYYGELAQAGDEWDEGPLYENEMNSFLDFGV